MSSLIKASVLLRENKTEEEQETMRNLGLEQDFDYADFYFRKDSIEAFFAEEDETTISLHFKSGQLATVQHNKRVLEQLIAI